MTLVELTRSIEARAAGQPLVVSWLDKWDGSQLGAAHIDGKLFATWEAVLINEPVFDGATPRGPSDYKTLRFYDQLVECN